MITILLSLALAAAPNPLAADPHKDHAQHEGMKHEAGCKMDCCKGDKPMPCCEKMKKADAPAEQAGGHEHAH